MMDLLVERACGYRILRAASAALAGTLASALSLAGGCASSGDAGPAPGGVVVASSSPVSNIEAGRISEHVAERAVFVPWPAEGPASSADSGSTKRMVIIRSRRDDPQADGHGSSPTTWLINRTRVEPGAPLESAKLEREQKLVLTEGHSVALSQEINHVEKVRVEFEPPMWVLPARLPTDGSQCVFESVRMTVLAIDNPKDIRARGRVKHSVCYEADETLETPAGRFQAHRLVSRFNADLGTSRVENITTQWFVQDVGLVAEQRHEQSWALGVKIRDNRESWIVGSIDAMK
jgi:hypothetical protein